MASIKEITVSTKRTQGLPGYSSITKEALVTLSLEEKEDYQEVFKHAWELVNQQVEKELVKYVDPDWINDPNYDKPSKEVKTAPAKLF